MGNAGFSMRPPEAQLDCEINGVLYRIVFEEKPFAVNGACRLAFRGVYRGNGPLTGKQCVTRIFVDPAKLLYSNYQPRVKASQKANEFAAAFNAYYAGNKLPGMKPLRFLVPEVATVTRIPRGNQYAVSLGDKILVEDLLQGCYEKFNSNSGWLTGSDAAAAISAFSHFTYWTSGGEFLVCDLQGVRTPDGYALTDPAVHSRRQGAYGPTDLGPVGMARFFDTHRCSSVCRQFRKPEFSNSMKINRGRADRRPSTYTFMLADDELAANRHFENRRDLPAVVEQQEQEGTSDIAVIGAISAAAAIATVLGVALLKR